MKIKSIETFTSDYLAVVRVKTECGLEGYGQTAPYHADITTAVLHQQIAPNAIGRNPLNIAELVQDCIEKNYKFTGSYICRALSGLDSALWDLKGKLENKSVCNLLGGKRRHMQVYGSSMSRTIQPEEEAARLVNLQQERGFAAFKIRIGKEMGHNRDEWEGRTERILETARNALGWETDLMVDANSCYTPDKAIEVGKLLQQYGVCHYEEPCPYWEYEWTKQVADALDIPVAAGEQESLMQVWRRLIELKAVDIVQPDICYIGGINRTLEASAMAERQGLLCMPHAANRSLISVFTLHVMGAIPNAAPVMEFSIEPDPWFEGIYEPVLEVKDGRVNIPDGAGWGVTLNKEWLANASYRITES